VRRVRGCSTAFCQTHAVTIAEITYCRRHGGTIKAIGDRGREPGSLPDLDDRSASLVGWIARDLDQPIRDLLTQSARPGEKVVVDDEVTLSHDAQRRSRWERSWRLVESTGVIIK